MKQNGYDRRMDEENDDWITVSEFCEILKARGIHPDARRIRRFAENYDNDADGRTRLEAFKDGKSWYLKRSDAETFTPPGRGRLPYKGAADFKKILSRHPDFKKPVVSAKRMRATKPR